MGETLKNETRFVGEIAVQRYQIIGTRIWVYAAWEPSPRRADSVGTVHSTITSIDSQPGWYGAIGTRELPPEIEALPRGDARIEACRAYREREHARAREAIVAAFPEAARGTPQDGQIELIV